MELSKQDKVVMSVIKTLQEMGLTVVSTTTELGTSYIYILSRRDDGVEIIAIVDSEGRTMKPDIKLSALSNHELSVLEQQILAEQCRRVVGSPNVIVVEPEAPEEEHREAIQKLLERKSH